MSIESDLESLSEALDELKSRLEVMEFAYEFAMRFDDGSERLRAVEWARGWCDKWASSKCDYNLARLRSRELLVGASANLRELRVIDAFQILAFQSGMEPREARDIAGYARIAYSRWEEYR